MYHAHSISSNLQFGSSFPSINELIHLPTSSSADPLANELPTSPFMDGSSEAKGLECVINRAKDVRCCGIKREEKIPEKGVKGIEGRKMKCKAFQKKGGSVSCFLCIL